MSDKPMNVSINKLVSEDGASELATSPDMQPYIRLALARLQKMDIATNVEEIAELPLERRYIWRVASALKWGFADFDSASVAVDRETLSPDELTKIMELLRLRPIQFCMFMKTLVGAENMERLMAQGIAIAKQER
jgi:hypothetical protein